MPSNELCAESFRTVAWAVSAMFVCECSSATEDSACRCTSVCGVQCFSFGTLKNRDKRAAKVNVECVEYSHLII